MGEMCDFEADWFPGAWDKRRKKPTRIEKLHKRIEVTLTNEQYAKYKQIGGAVALRRLIEAAALPGLARGKEDGDER